MYSVCLVTSFTLERCKLQHINQVGIKTEQIEKLREALHHPRITLSPINDLVLNNKVTFSYLVNYLKGCAVWKIITLFNIHFTRFRKQQMVDALKPNAAWADFNVFTSFTYKKIHTARTHARFKCYQHIKSLVFHQKVRSILSNPDLLHLCT